MSYKQFIIFLCCFFANAYSMDLPFAKMPVLSTMEVKQLEQHIITKFINITVIRSARNNTLLHCAAFFNIPAIVDWWHYRRSKYLIQNDDGCTALHFARTEEMVDKLLRCNADLLTIVSHNNETPLHYSAIIADAGVMRALIKRGVRCNALDKQGRSALSRLIAHQLCSVIMAQNKIYFSDYEQKFAVLIAHGAKLTDHELQELKTATRKIDKKIAIMEKVLRDCRKQDKVPRYQEIKTNYERLLKTLRSLQEQ